jgi:hypothetical protein
MAQMVFALLLNRALIPSCPPLLQRGCSFFGVSWMCLQVWYRQSNSKRPQRTLHPSVLIMTAADMLGNTQRNMTI